MHPALMIDEIIRLVFSFSGGDEVKTLAVVARSCKAWSDPALDLLWCHLSTIKPLLLLLPKRFITADKIVLADALTAHEIPRFNFYAVRVKHISSRQEANVYSNADFTTCFDYGNPALPFLSTAHISFSKPSPTLMPLFFSSSLIRLDIDIGFKLDKGSNDTTLCNYLERVSHSYLGLRHISLRGRASERLNRIIASLSTVHSLSLRLGTSLLPFTLKAVMDFPSLSDLEVHAGHINFGTLYDIKEEFILLNDIHRLHIRAQAAFIEHVIYRIPLNTLQHLHIELDDPSPCTTFWNSCFASIANNSQNSLNHLSIEHFFELTEASQPGPPSSNSAAVTTSTDLQFDALESLRLLKNLRHFSCDITIPPTITDRDVEKIVVWWPQLQHFELGFTAQFEGLDVLHRPQLTTSCLQLFATRSLQLRNLILPLTVGDVALPPLNKGLSTLSASPLYSLTIASLTTTAPESVVHYLKNLFPALQNLDSPNDNDFTWKKVTDVLQSLAH